MKALIVVVVLIIISLFYSYRYGKYNAELSLLRGFWESNKDFNDESGLKSFTMYIGEKDCGEYPTYLLMVDNEEKILVNAPTNMSLAGSWFGSSEPDCHEFVATFTDLNSEFIPNKICFKLQKTLSFVKNIIKMKININFQKQVLPHIIAIITFAVITILYYSPILEGKRIKQDDIVRFEGSNCRFQDLW